MRSRSRLFAGDTGVRADASGLQFVDARADREARSRASTACCCAAVERGHPLFGPACELIRAEALIRLTASRRCRAACSRSASASAQSFDTRHGSELLIFLGRVLTRCMGRWLIP